MTPVTIESLDQEGRGVARREGKVLFIEGALPGEVVEYSSYRKKSNFELAQISRVIVPSPMRVIPKCPYFGTCGGCSMQHVDGNAQVAAKQRILEDNLWHIGKVRAEQVLPPIYGPEWEYRYRARFAVRLVARKGGVLVGFHEKRSSFIADMASCEVIPKGISALIMPLRELIGALSIRDRLPQVEVAVGDTVEVLVLRLLQPLNSRDEELIRTFAERHGIRMYLQPGGPDSAYPFHPTEPADLFYTLPEFNIKMPFQPTDFTQVNTQINRVLVRRAVSLLDPKPGERIVDLFCGLGNFTLPIARRGAQVIGFEGNESLILRARDNAARNGLEHRTEFHGADLFRVTNEWFRALGKVDKMLIDPPRDGAVEAVKALGEIGPRRIVYVSCNPATLARDAAVLTHAQGYVLRAAGVVNMFPHTAHVESVAVFEKRPPAL